MTALKYNLVSMGDESNLTVVHGGEMYVASETHPNWESILKGVLAGDPTVVELFDVSATVAKRFDRLTDRATVANGRLYFDGDEMHNALSAEVIRFIDEGVDDWKPLVAFLEKVMQNPQEHSREQLFSWMSNKNFSITPDGDIVGYKSVRSDGEDGYTSINSGTATVNGEVKTGRIPQKIGDIVEMPRSEVAFDPSQGCSTGLHVANWDYATTWTNHDAVLLVAVNPRDVVSVPTDCDFQKVRVCRYKVIDTIDHVVEAPVYTYSSTEDDDDYDPDEDEGYCDYCGEYGHEEEDCDEKIDEDEEEYCDYCEESGHIEENCDKRIDDEDTAKSKEDYEAQHRATGGPINTPVARDNPPTSSWSNSSLWF